MTPEFPDLRTREQRLADVMQEADRQFVVESMPIFGVILTAFILGAVAGAFWAFDRFDRDFLRPEQSGKLPATLSANPQRGASWTR